MNKINIAKKLLKELGINLLKNECDIVHIPGNYMKLITEIFDNNNSNIKFSFTMENDGEFIQSKFHK